MAWRKSLTAKRGQIWEQGLPCLFLGGEVYQLSMRLWNHYKKPVSDICKPRSFDWNGSFFRHRQTNQGCERDAVADIGGLVAVRSGNLSKRSHLHAMPLIAYRNSRQITHPKGVEMASQTVKIGENEDSNTILSFLKSLKPAWERWNGTKLSSHPSLRIAANRPWRNFYWRWRQRIS